MANKLPSKIFNEFAAQVDNFSLYKVPNGPITTKLKKTHEYHKAVGSDLNNFIDIIKSSNKNWNKSKFPNYNIKTGYDTLNENNNWFNCSQIYTINGDHSILSTTSKRGTKESIQFTFGNNQIEKLGKINIKCAEIGNDKAKHDTQPASLKTGKGIGLLHDSNFYIYLNGLNSKYRVKVNFKLCDDYLNHLKKFVRNHKIPKNCGKWSKEMTGIIVLVNKEKTFEYITYFVQQHAQLTGIKRITYLPIVTAQLQTNDPSLINNKANLLTIKGKGGFSGVYVDNKINLNQNNSDDNEYEITNSVKIKTESKTINTKPSKKRTRYSAMKEPDIPVIITPEINEDCDMKLNQRLNDDENTSCDLGSTSPLPIKMADYDEINPGLELGNNYFDYSGFEPIVSPLSLINTNTIQSYPELNGNLFEDNKYLFNNDLDVNPSNIDFNLEFENNEIAPTQFDSTYDLNFIDDLDYQFESQPKKRQRLY